MDLWRRLLMAALLVSAILRGIILAFDGLLWYDNPVNGHAYALILFTLVDIALIGLIASGRGARTVLVWAIIQVLALALNPLTAFTINISTEEFTAYLFGLTPVESTGNISCPFLCPPFRYSYTALLIAQIAMAFTALRLARAMRA